MALNHLDLLRHSGNAIRRNLFRDSVPQETVERASGADEAVSTSDFGRPAEANLDSFRELIRKTDDKLDRCLAVMEEMGVPEGIAKYHILREVRTVEQVNILKSVNKGQALQTTIPECTQLYEQYLECDVPDDFMPEQARSVEHTSLEPCERTVDGITYVLYGDPEAERARLIRMQGTSRYPMRGTCGLCSTGNVLTMAGAEQANEEDIIGLSLHASEELMDVLELFDPNPDNRGGTTSKNRMELLAMRGVESELLYVRSDRKRTMEELARLVKEGHGVILSVEVARLWKRQRGGHAITLVAVSEDGQTFFYCDTGMGCTKSISARELGYCLTGSPCNVTKYPIR